MESSAAGRMEKSFAVPSNVQLRSFVVPLRKQTRLSASECPG
jgi:hypothetical protein